MAMPIGNLNLQQVIRDLEKRVSELEARLNAQVSESTPEEPANGQAEAGSAPEPAAAG